MDKFFNISKKINLTPFLLLIFCSVFFLCYAQSARVVRVALTQDAKSLSLKVNGFYEIIDSQTGHVLFRGKNLRTTATVYPGGILVGKTAMQKNKLLVRGADAFAITIDGRKFRGDIELVNKDGRYIFAVNNIDLEDYIKGILYHEASHYWPPEALKAQAIACRTYALYQMQENSHRDYDVTSDTYSQVYGGKTSERYRTNKVVDETKGLVLTYQNKTFPAFFSATCGGHTEDAGLLWNVDLVPLKGVPCGFCKESPHFSWHSVLSLGEIEKALSQSDYKISGIEGIQIEGRDKSGRVTKLKISAQMKNIEIPAKDFRIIIGANDIRSTNFKLEIIEKDAVIEGIGWGHGVGLCQWGAYFMAKSGKSYEEILKYYYPGAEVQKSIDH